MSHLSPGTIGYEYRIVYEYLVHSGSGHNGPRKFDNYREAKAYAKEVAATPSYFRENQRTHAQVVSKTTITIVEDIW